MLKNIVFIVLLISLAVFTAKIEASNKFNIILTFDDGPANSTMTILDVLKKHKAKAVFFVLTQPDIFENKIYHKADTVKGFEILTKVAKEGHLLAVHWGGSYLKQNFGHWRRVLLPPYDFSNSGFVQKATSLGNALETDLIECMQTLQKSYQMASIAGQKIEFVRPPIWKYKENGLDARYTYENLNLKMILTDVKLGDAGYVTEEYRKNFEFAVKNMIEGITKIIKSEHKPNFEYDLVLTLHDSNQLTAEKFDSILITLEQELDKMIPGRWEYLKTRSELAHALQRKKYFRLQKYDYDKEKKAMYLNSENPCDISSTYAQDIEQCRHPSVYAGPLKAGNHGGVCLQTKSECTLVSRLSISKNCGFGSVYVGPEDSISYGGTCISEYSGKRLLAISTKNKSCLERGVKGIYVGPNKPQTYGGSCFYIETIKDFEGLTKTEKDIWSIHAKEEQIDHAKEEQIEDELDN